MNDEDKKARKFDLEERLITFAIQIILGGCHARRRLNIE